MWREEHAIWCRLLARTPSSETLNPAARTLRISAHSFSSSCANSFLLRGAPHRAASRIQTLVR
jgi:hypothetical protein